DLIDWSPIVPRSVGEYKRQFAPVHDAVFVLSSAPHGENHGTAGSGVGTPPRRARGADRSPHGGAAALARRAGSPATDGAATLAAHRSMRRRAQTVDRHRRTPRGGGG